MEGKVTAKASRIRDISDRARFHHLTLEMPVQIFRGILEKIMHLYSLQKTEEYGQKSNSHNYYQNYQAPHGILYFSVKHAPQVVNKFWMVDMFCILACIVIDVLVLVFWFMRNIKNHLTKCIQLVTEYLLWI